MSTVTVNIAATDLQAGDRVFGMGTVVGCQTQPTRVVATIRNAKGRMTNWAFDLDATIAIGPRS